MFAALSMSSTLIRMMSALRRISTPATPISEQHGGEHQEVAVADVEQEVVHGVASRARFFGASVVGLVQRPRDRDRADHRDEQQDRDRLEREQAAAEQVGADRLRP